MSKTTIAIIVILYLVSIFWVGFFGLSVKVVDKVKYVDEITVKIEAEKTEMFDIFEKEKTEPGANNEYELQIYFYDEHLVYEGDKYLPLTILPHVKYMSGDVASTEEKIKFIPDDNMKHFQESGVVSFDRGQLVINDPGTSEEAELFAFKLTISPENSSRNGSSAVVWITVINFER